MNLFFSLLGLGTIAGGIFAGTLQQNFSHPQVPEIDLLFKEIEEDIREFSRENPISDNDKDYIKKPQSSSSEVQSRKRRDTDNSKKSENTLNVWTDIWVQLVSGYLSTLWSKRPEAKRKHWIISTIEEKNEALKQADKWIEQEKKKFEKKLSSKQSQIEEIYQKMREFALLTNIPEDYQTGSLYYPYEHHIKKILEE